MNVDLDEVEEALVLCRKYVKQAYQKAVVNQREFNTYYINDDEQFEIREDTKDLLVRIDSLISDIRR